MFNYKCKLKEGMGFFYSFPSINGCPITNANSRKGWVSFVLFLP
jgi:hypothetical protein